MVCAPLPLYPCCPVVRRVFILHRTLRLKRRSRRQRVDAHGDSRSLKLPATSFADGGERTGAAGSICYEIPIRTLKDWPYKDLMITVRDRFLTDQHPQSAYSRVASRPFGSGGRFIRFIYCILSTSSWVRRLHSSENDWRVGKSAGGCGSLELRF
jgi:hypothetical protein